MNNAQLYQHFKDNGITLEEIAEKTGYSLMYLLNMLQGHEPLTDSARFKFIRAYPKTAAFLVHQPESEPA
jgi:transcriptional regulator with XRE-family HTH domain